MNERTKKGLDCIEAALLLGVMGDALLRATPWGVNVLLWVGVLVLAFIALIARWRSDLLKEEGRWVVLPVLFFAAAFAWRDSMTLKSLDFLLLLLSLALVGWRAKANKIRLAGMMEYAQAIALHTANALFASFHWRSPMCVGRSATDGVVAAVGPSCVDCYRTAVAFCLGCCSWAADAVFEGSSTKGFHINFENIIFAPCGCSSSLRGSQADFARSASGKEGLSTGEQTVVSLGLAAAVRVATRAKPLKTSRWQQSRPLRWALSNWASCWARQPALPTFWLVPGEYFFGGAALVQLH